MGKKWVLKKVIFFIFADEGTALEMGLITVWFLDEIIIIIIFIGISEILLTNMILYTRYTKFMFLKIINY